jgi:hypothetical protein
MDETEHTNTATAPDAATPPTETHQQQGFFKKHLRTLAVLAIGATIVGIIVVLAQAREADKPSINQASTDFADLTHIPSYEPGDFGHADTLVLDSVNFVKVAREGEICTADGVLSFSGESVALEQEVTLTYVRANNGGWMVEGNPLIRSNTWRPIEGADQERVAAHASELLQQADASAAGLYDLYRNAGCAVASQTLDSKALADTLVLHFEDEGGFVAHQMDLAVLLHFNATNGQWELASCTPDDAATEPDFTPLIGSWRGVFTAQKNAGNSCYAARTAPLDLRIESVTVGRDNSVSIAGRLSALVHRHASLTADADSSAGDELVEQLSFAGELTASAHGYVCSCSVVDAKGELALELEFGTQDGPEGARATLVSNRRSVESALTGNYQPSGSFADIYLLTRVAQTN